MRSVQSPKFGTGTGELGNKRTRGNHPKLQHCWDRSEYWEESSEKSANAGVKNSEKRKSNYEIPNWKTSVHDGIDGFWFKNSLLSTTDWLYIHSSGFFPGERPRLIICKIDSTQLWNEFLLFCIQFSITMLDSSCYQLWWAGGDLTLLSCSV